MSMRPEPMDGEIERAALHALLVDPERANETVGELLDAGLWATPTLHAAAKVTIGRLRRREPVDPLVVASDLRQAGKQAAAAEVTKLYRTRGAVGDLPAYVKQLEVLRGKRQDTAGRLGFVVAANVKEAPVTWLWPGFIPRGKITILDGLPDVGKTTLALAVAANVTRGLALPHGPREREPQDVLILSAEDGLGDTLRPRLAAAGADLGRVLLHDGTKPEAPPIFFPDAAEPLRELVAERRPGLVIIDPISAYIDPVKYDAHRDQDVRVALRPLRTIAEESGAAVKLIRHLNKTVGLPALLRGSGSVAFSGLARSVLLAARHPEDQGLRVLASVKCNLAPESMRKALIFRLGDDGHGRPRVEWAGTSNLGADELLEPRRPGPAADQRERAVDFLRDLLANGARPRREVIDSARKASLSERTVERAMGAAGVVSETRGTPGRGGEAWWSLAPDGGVQP